MAGLICSFCHTDIEAEEAALLAQDIEQLQKSGARPLRQGGHSCLEMSTAFQSEHLQVSQKLRENEKIRAAHRRARLRDGQTYDPVGRVGIGTEIFECAGCGAVVSDRNIHDNFHVSLRQTAENAAYSEMPRPLASGG